MSTLRNYHFDNVRSLLILLVVFGHMIEPLRDIQVFKFLYLIIYSFHMPLFIFLSGYYARPNTKGLKKLLVLLLKYEILYALFYALIFNDSTNTNFDGNIISTIGYALQPIWVLWFLLSLISWRLLLIIYEKHPIFIIIILSLVIGYNFIPVNFRILSLGRTLSFFPYFLLGYLANKHNIDLHHHRKKRVTFYFASLLLLFWILYSGSVTEELLYGATSFSTNAHSASVLILLKINIYLIAIATSIIVLNLVPMQQNRFTSIGTKTLPIYLLHPFIIWLLLRINLFDQLRHLNIGFSLIILLTLSILITLFLKERKV